MSAVVSSCVESCVSSGVGDGGGGGSGLDLVFYEDASQQADQAWLGSSAPVVSYTGAGTDSNWSQYGSNVGPRVYNATPPGYIESIGSSNNTANIDTLFTPADLSGQDFVGVIDLLFPNNTPTSERDKISFFNLADVPGRRGCIQIDFLNQSGFLQIKEGVSTTTGTLSTKKSYSYSYNSDGVTHDIFYWWYDNANNQFSIYDGSFSQIGGVDPAILSYARLHQGLYLYCNYGANARAKWYKQGCWRGSDITKIPLAITEATG